MSWMMFFFFKQKTAYEMRISDWSSDVCSSDLIYFVANGRRRAEDLGCTFRVTGRRPELWDPMTGKTRALPVYEQVDGRTRVALRLDEAGSCFVVFREPAEGGSTALTGPAGAVRSEEHTSELQSLMRNSYAVFCLKKKTISTRKQRCNPI